MPVTKPHIKPKNQKELTRKILATEPGQEDVIIRDVQEHLGQQGFSSYQQTRESERDVILTGAKCIIFLIGGRFKVGEEDVIGQLEGHLVENEVKIQLQKKTAVVIISVSST